jgi:capsular polysaccharide transport system permease protein
MAGVPIREWPSRAYRWCARNRLFVFVTVVPTLLGTLYFGIFDSDVYQSASSIIVRSPLPQQASADALGGFLRDVGFARAQDEAYTVEEYLTSRDALTVLVNDKDLHIAKAFGSPGVDRLSRFAGLTGDSSFEALYLYSQKKITVLLDPNSSIIELTTEAFSADDAYNMNRLLLEHAEVLVNKLNEQARQDMIGFSLEEVERDQKQVARVEAALGAYRNKMHVLDPEKQAPISLQLISKLQEDLVAAKAKVLQIQLVARGSPELEVAKQRVTVLEGEIDREEARIAGAGHDSLAGKAIDYQRLLVDREAASRMLGSALGALEQARNEALRKELYLEHVVEPSRPDYAEEPKRVRDILVTLAISLMTWGILSLFVAGVKEHHD